MFFCLCKRLRKGIADAMVCMNQAGTKLGKGCQVQVHEEAYIV